MTNVFRLFAKKIKGRWEGKMSPARVIVLLRGSRRQSSSQPKNRREQAPNWLMNSVSMAFSQVVNISRALKSTLTSSWSRILCKHFFFYEIISCVRNHLRNVSRAIKTFSWVLAQPYLKCLLIHIIIGKNSTRRLGFETGDWNMIRLRLKFRELEFARILFRPIAK